MVAAQCKHPGMAVPQLATALTLAGATIWVKPVAMNPGTIVKSASFLLLLSFAVPLWATAASARTDYVCSGEIRSENIFESGSAAFTHKQYRLIVNTDNNTAKRDPELAAGCLTRQIEICRCELNADAVRCLSMGINSGGQEVQADFTLDRSSQQMHVTGRMSDPQTGRLIETQGMLSCEVQPASPY